MGIPPLLSEHTEELRRRGYRVEVNASGESEFCVVLKDYPIPSDIWSRDKIDLMITAQPTYPNSKLDMFWVDPPITLKDGRKPNAGDLIEDHCGRRWQRFSWHIPYWNPAKDNLITYLYDTVNLRFRKAE
jgi:hypothetical protein